VCTADPPVASRAGVEGASSVRDPAVHVVDDPLCHWLVSLQVGVARGRQQSGNT